MFEGRNKESRVSVHREARGLRKSLQLKAARVFRRVRRKLRQVLRVEKVVALQEPEKADQLGLADVRAARH